MISGTKVEVRSLFGCLPSCRATGIDKLAIEIRQAIEEEYIRVLTKLCQQIWRIIQWPVGWKRSIYIPVSKKGDLAVCVKYRTENPTWKADV